MCNQVHIYIYMETTENKAIRTLLTGVIFLLLIQGCVRLMQMHVYHLYLVIFSNQLIAGAQNS